MAVNYSQAFSLAPTGNWDGNDGAWSTFMIRVGTPAQLFRVLPATNVLESWIPIPDQCSRGMGWCGNARGVEPYNGITASPFSGSPNETATTTIDAGLSCTANRSPSCYDCVSINGQCTNGPCKGRYCCGDPAGDCTSPSCGGLNGICTGSYIGCPCVGVDFNASPSVQVSSGGVDALAASGFQANQSSTWTATGTQQLSSEGYLGVASNGQFGTDTVGLGVDSSSGLTLPEVVVAGIPAEPFYMGTLGLKSGNATSSNNSTASLMSQLKQQNLIPSLSYGYTAGAFYKQKPTLGSLTLGGYDTSRMVPNDLSFPLTGNDTQSLMIQLQSISASASLSSSEEVALLSENITVTIDSSLPFIWLPLSACQVFEEAFGLTWNASTEMYLINDTVHQSLLTTDPSITFTIGNMVPGSQSINITLPYGAFDLQAASPIFANGTNYFPLRRAAGENQYSLGRTFLQEAYLLVDYETSNFSVSQAQFPTGAGPNIVTINHARQENASASPQTHSKHSLSKGAIAGAVIGSIVGVMLLVVLGFLTFRRYHGKREKSESDAGLARPSNEEEKSMPYSPSHSNSDASAQTTLHAMVTPGTETTGSATDHTRSTDHTRTELESNTAGSPQTPTTPMVFLAKPMQELQGSDTSKELPQSPPGTPPRKLKHIAELAADDKRPPAYKF